MAIFKTEVFVECETEAEANKVLVERLQGSQEYGFSYHVWFYHDHTKLPSEISAKYEFEM